MVKMRVICSFVILWAMVYLAGCGGTSAQPLPASTTAPQPTSEGTRVNPLPGTAELVAQARADLAKRLSAAPDSFRVKSVEAVDWPDASLGCPQRGVMYIQVITPGFKIVLEANGKEYAYHSDGKRIFLCER